MHRKQLFLLGLVVSFLVPLTGANAQPIAAPRPDIAVKDVDAALHNEWFGVYSQSKKVGYANKVLEKVAENGQTIYRERHVKKEMLQISGQKLQYTSEEHLDFDARPPFKLLRGECRDDDGQTKKHVKFAVQGKVREVIQTTGNVTTKKTLPDLDYTLADSLALTHWLKKGPAQGETLTTQDFTIRTGKLTFVTAKMGGTKEVLREGMKRTELEVEMHLHDVDMTLACRFGKEGKLISASLAGLMEVRRESELQAKNIESSDDLFDRFLAKIDRPIGALPTVAGLVMEARCKEAALLPNGSLQKVVSQGNDVFLVKIGKNHGIKVKASAKEISEGLEETADYPLQYARVVELARKAVAGARTDEEKVKQLVKFVYDYMIPSTEESGKQAEIYDILERKRGVCRHYARLFACLSRAAGIPTREVAGLLYLGDEAKSFGPHQWNEVVLDGHWVQIDAVVNSTALKPVYVYLGTGKDGEANLVKTAGKLSFKLLEVERIPRDPKAELQRAKLDPKRHEGKGRVFEKDAGFSIIPPKGWEKSDKGSGPAFLVVTGPKENFTPNLNVIVVDDDGTPIEKFGPAVKERLAGQYKKWQLVDDGLLTINGKKTYRVCSRFLLPDQEQEVQALQYIIIGDNDKVYILSFLGTPAVANRLQKDLEESARSALTD